MTFDPPTTPRSPGPSSNALIFIGEIGQLCDVAPSTVSNWANRYADFPKPLHTFRRSAVYSRQDALAWIAKRK